MRGFFFLHTFIQDLKYAARGLRKNPGFVAVVVASLALGIGANSTIFSVMNALLYRPLPYRGADRMVALCWLALYRLGARRKSIPSTTLHYE